MSAGISIRHSEYNLEYEVTRFFQIWIIPDQRGGELGWGARPFTKADRAGQFVTLASGMDGDGDALPIRANARVLGATLKAGESLTDETDASRHAYLVPATGRVTIDGMNVATRDDAAITALDRFIIEALEDSEIVMVDAA